MNFHKTIGYLAALLLIVGIGVPDSFAQDANTIVVELSRDNYVREGSSVVVTVTLDPAPAANSTTTVTLEVAASEGYDYNTNPSLVDENGDARTVVQNPTVEVEVVGAAEGTSSGTSVPLYISDDDVFVDGGTLTVGADNAGVYTFADDADVELPIRDNDDPTGALTLTVSPPAFTAGDASPQTATLTVALAEAPGETDAGVDITVTVAITATVGDATTISVSDITISGDEKEGTTTLTLTSTDAADAGTVMVTASADDYESDSISINIIQRTAMDVEGFRVNLVAPGDGAWAGAAAKKVKVEVTRLDKTQSYPWTDFQSLAVSLRDTANASHAIITVTAGNFADQDGDIVFTKTILHASGATANEKNSLIDYDEPADKLTFQIELLKITAANTAVGILGTLEGESTSDGTVDNPDADDNHPQAGITARGQRMGVYASAAFTVGNDTYTLNSNDDKKKVFSNPATPGADQAVGDGKHIKIDLLPPDNAASAINITLNNSDDSAEATEAKIGDELKIEVPVSGQQRFLRDGGMQIQVLTIANDDASGNAKAATLLTENFNQAQISSASGDALRASLKLTEGKIKTLGTIDGHTRDGVEIKKAVSREPDYVGLRVHVRTKDQAGNFSGIQAGATQKDLTGDTRAPGIHVLYPAAGDRITGDHADTNWDEFLNPLRIRLDEDIDSLYVYADGALEGNDVEDIFEKAAIVLWSPGDDRDLDRSEVVARHGATSVGDTIIYNTVGLQFKKGNNDLAATAQGGTAVDLVIVAKDLVGNKTTMTLDGVIHDQLPPEISDWFPRNDLLEDDDNQINEATRHPVITLKEAVDSLSVTYDPSSGDDIVEEIADGLATGEHQVIITDPFVADRTYTLTIFARDLAGNAFETPATASENLKFDADFDNPEANMFTVRNFDPTDMAKNAQSDSVVAGQAFHLRLKAMDNNDTPDNDDDDRDALTYKNRDQDGNLASEVRISAWDADGAASSVIFHGKGVSDNGDGSATLDAGEWKLGERTVWAKSNKTVDGLKILVEHRNPGEGSTSMVAFKGDIEDLTVDAADFQGFELTAWEEGVDGAATSVWGDFTLKVVPVDRHGNESVKAYKAAPAKAAAGAADSLNILDTRVKDNGFNYKNGIDVTFRSNPPLEDLPSLFEWSIPLAGDTFDLVAPANKKNVDIQVLVVNESIDADDTRSQDIKTTKRFPIAAPLTPFLTLWVPGSDMDEAGNDVVIPAGDDGAMVTVAAEGYNPGSTVTFTLYGNPREGEANDDGVAKLDITRRLPGTVKVSATDGVYATDELSIVFVDAPVVPPTPMRQAYVNAEGEAVYLISDTDMTVGVDDFLAFIAAYGSSEGDENYSLQADVDDDGDVDLQDYLEFITSYGREAVGPSTKPLVLLPGINENAEFLLSLGSERVIAGELVAVDVSLANVEALMGYGFALNYETDKFEFVSVAPADEDLLKSTGGETPLFHHIVADGQITVANGIVNGTAVSGGGDVVRFVFRVLYEFEDNARFEIADGLVFDPSQLQNPALVAGVLELQSTPREFALHQNFPNPFNPDTTIKYDLAESADITLQIYNVLGQVVRTLVVSEAQNAGRYQIRWNGMDDRGVPVSSGVYFYRISADGKFQNVRKLMLLK